MPRAIVSSRDEWWYKLADLAADTAFRVRRDRARPLPEREHQAERHARNAVVWLENARKEGYFARRSFAPQGMHWWALRHRDDYKQLLGRIKKKGG